jgi:NMD protein affecting ribosome stability and mRNA decay
MDQIFCESCKQKVDMEYAFAEDMCQECYELERKGFNAGNEWQVIRCACDECNYMYEREGDDVDTVAWSSSNPTGEREVE